MRSASRYGTAPDCQIRGKKKVRRTRRSLSTFTILASLASFAAGGFAGSGGRRVATTGGGGLLQRIIGISRGGFGAESRSSNSNRSIYGSFVASAAPLTPSFSRSSSSSHDTELTAKGDSSVKDNEMPAESCSDTESNEQSTMMPSKISHPDDPSLWLYHIEHTTSTMDEAKSIVEKKFLDAENDNAAPTSFLISATSQSNGRGTTKRNWKSSQRGNALFTIGIPQSSWMKELKMKNGGTMVPLTLLPLKIGSLVAFHVQKALEECASKSGGETQQQQQMPRATVKWPNDVLLHTSQNSHEKIAGILIESAQDWFMIGIGINVGYAPAIPKEGNDYGRKATSLSQYCNTPPSEGEVVNTDNNEEEFWINLSKKLATDIAYDLHSWFHPTSPSAFIDVHSGKAILNQWKAYIDWDMELILRDTPKRERVKLKSILEDGRVVVQEVETGLTRTLVSDYFL